MGWNHEKDGIDVDVGDLGREKSRDGIKCGASIDVRGQMRTSVMGRREIEWERNQVLCPTMSDWLVIADTTVNKRR